MVPVFIGCLVVGLPVPLLAQFTTASLNGGVSDSTGASIPNAKVTSVNLETGLARTTSTGEDGAFLFPLLPVGTYRLNVEKAGFSRYVQEGIALSVNQSATQNVVLQVGRMESEVRVVADAGMLNTQTATLSQLIDNQRVADLPLNGRTAQSLVFLAPGTVLGPATGEGGTYPNAEQVAVVNGGERLSVNYLMDGAGHNDTYVGVNLPFPNPGAIQEFNLQTTNMSAEFGNGTSVVSIVTKSGTNQLHGDAFEFLRNGDLNARNFFAPTHDTLNRNQYGGTAGGPIRKDRLFLFGTYQGTRNDTAAAGGVAFVPTAAERNGDLSAIAKQLTDPATHAPFPNNQIPLSQITGPAQYFMKYLPAPNGPNGQLTYLGPHDNSDDEQFMTKVDYNRGKNQISGRYFFTRYNLPPDESTVLQNLLAMDPNGTRVRVQTLALNHTYSATPTLLFNTWFGWDSQVGGSLSGDPANAPITYPAAGVQMAGGANGVPPAIEGLAVSGFFSIASGHFGTFNRGDWRIRETVTHERNGHELIFGGEAVRVRLDINNQNTQSGSFTFGGQLSGSNLSDFLLGDSSSFTQGAGQFTNVRGTIYSLFVQDNWRVSKKLTLNLGLRWDPFWPYTETKNRVPCFIIGEQSKVFPNAPTGLVYGGDPGCPAGTGSNSSPANFAPRLGFAYQLGSRTVIRGGAGIYYAPLPENVFDGTGATAPFTPRFTLTGASFVNPYGSAGVPNPFPAQFTGGIVSSPNVSFTLPVQASNSYGTYFSAPTMSTWNLHVERQFGGNWLASAGYIGNAGWHLSSSQNTNANGNVQANPAVYIPGQSTVANTQARRLVPTLSSVTQYQTDYNTRYDGLQLTMERRLSRGLTLLGNYTWSKRIDNYPGTKGVGTDPFDRNFDWGVSPDDRTHIFNLSAVWQIPVRFAGPAGRVLNGWEATSITSWQSGVPFSILSGVDNSFSGNGRDRADFIGMSISQARRSGLSHATEIQKFFNTSLFVPNVIGTFGNSGKDILRGPRSFDTDMALIKNTKLMERLTLQLRGEFFNVFNNVNFGAPGATVGTPAFGEITSAGNPRILQFSAKLLF